MPIINMIKKKTIKPVPYKEFAQQFKDIFAQSKMQCSQKRKQSNPEM